jgi:saccharopine dehydrogenase-like NADP-dependent oxidoreductase
MKILVLGSGLMGPAAAYNAMTDPDVRQVTLCDRSQEQLDAARAKLSSMKGSEKLSSVALDLSDLAAATKLMAGHDAILAALPWPIIPFGIRAAVAAGTPLVDLAWPPLEQVEELSQWVDQEGGLVILGCGVEPGLTEIMARYLAEKLDRIDELHIKCGGIPEKPAPPLGYKIVFGGRELPMWDRDAYICKNGELTAVPRYSGAQAVRFAGVGDCEVYHEGFFPWLLDLDVLKGLKLGTQMTVRWPGYTAKAALLRDLGLVSTEPVDVDGVEVAPKALLDALLYPHVKMDEGEIDITCFRVEASGEEDGQPRRYRIEMVDRYDEEMGFTSMARTTAMTGAIVARMIARGELKAKGWQTPEKVIAGSLFDTLVDELAAINIRFEMTTEKIRPLV